MLVSEVGNNIANIHTDKQNIERKTKNLATFFFVDGGQLVL